MIGRILNQNKEWLHSHVRSYMVFAGYIIGLLGFYAMVIVAGYKGHGFYYYLDHIGSSSASRIFTYTNPFVILSAVCFFWCFEQKEFYSNTINKLSKSTFAILLIHSNPVAITFYIRYFKKLYENMSFLLYLGAMMGSCILFFVLSIVVDQLRIFIYDRGISPYVVRIEKKLAKENEVI